MENRRRYGRMLVNLLVAVGVVLLLIFVLPRILIFFMPFVIGWIIAMIANPLVRFLEKRMKIVRKHGSMIIIIGVLAAVILLLYLAGAKLVQEAVGLIDSLPEIYESAAAEFRTVGDNLQMLLERLPGEMRVNVSDVTSNLATYLGDLAQAVSVPTFEAAGNFAKNVPGTLIAIIMSLLSAYFFVADRDKMVAAVEQYMPKGIQSSVFQVIRDLKHVIGGYFKAQLKIMVVVYVILVVGLLILKVSYVPLVAFLIAFLDMLPVFGTGTVLGPWAILKILAGDYTMAVGLIILYAVTQLVRQIIQPKIVGDSIGMNPMATLFFMFVGYKFSGVVGMIVAVPVGMILINLYEAGVFDHQIRCLKELVHDFNEFRKL